MRKGRKQVFSFVKTLGKEGLGPECKSSSVSRDQIRLNIGKNY